jgi:hypothetical protein
VMWYTLLTSSTFGAVTKANTLLQLLLFTVTTVVPCLATGRMSYVDIAWPWGVLGIGAISASLVEVWTVRKVSMCAAYVCVGGRMGLGALEWLASGKHKKEFPRYAFRVLMWEREGKTHITLEMLLEIAKQALANLSFQPLPAFIVIFNDSTDGLHWVEFVAMVVFGSALVLESVADVSKLKCVPLPIDMPGNDNLTPPTVMDASGEGMTPVVRYLARRLTPLPGTAPRGLRTACAKTACGGTRVTPTTFSSGSSGRPWCSRRCRRGCGWPSASKSPRTCLARWPPASAILAT